MDSEADNIVFLISESHGVDISSLDPFFVTRVFESRAGSLFVNKNSYINHIRESREEADIFLRLLNVNFSVFFRNTFTYSVLEHIVIPALFRSSTDREIRVWSAACSSGQEPYSIAILFDELAKSGPRGRKYRIIASDINDSELESAGRAIYSPSSVDNVSLGRVKNYFTKHNDQYHLSSHIKESVDFSRFNLLDSEACCPPASIFGNFDLIICSNVLYYYKKEFRTIILDKIRRSMIPGGFLVTGEAEREFLLENGFYEFYTGSAIFKQ